MLFHPIIFHPQQSFACHFSNINSHQLPQTWLYLLHSSLQREVQLDVKRPAQDITPKGQSLQSVQRTQLLARLKTLDHRSCSVAFTPSSAV